MPKSALKKSNPTPAESVGSTDDSEKSNNAGSSVPTYSSNRNANADGKTKLVAIISLLSCCCRCLKVPERNFTHQDSLASISVGSKRKNKKRIKEANRKARGEDDDAASCVSGNESEY